MNHELKFLTHKLEHALSYLECSRYFAHFTPENIQFMAGKNYDESKFKPLTLGQSWGGYDQYAWLKFNFELPDDYQNHPHKLAKLNFGITGGGNNSGFESLAYLNDKIYQGVDSNHQELFLPPELQTGELKFLLWSGLDAGGGNLGISNTHQIQEVRFMLLDKATDDLYYLFITGLETLKYMTDNDPIYHQICNILDEAYNALPITSPSAIRAVAQQVYDRAKSALESIPRSDLVTIHTVGHTHIDVAWLWRLSHTREKVQRSFSTVLRLMERYPNYTFLQSQPQLYEYVKEDAPDLYEDIQKVAQTGRWEANGAMWIEADCNLTSGESLVRQLLYGQAFFKKELNKTSNCLWLPDVFGYSAALPQILKKSGINYFMTTKISSNQYNRIPNDTFYWQGIDGSKILSHFITTPSNFGSDWQSYTYSAEINGKSIQGIWRNYKNKQINQELLMSYGFGDGGGGVNREMLERLEKFSFIPGNHKIVPGHANSFFENLNANIQNKNVPNWQGELYLEFHRGTYTSQAITKKYNRKLEFMLRNTEIMATFYDKFDYDLTRLNEAWKKLLTNQFHDILPGSSITEVYEDAELTYQEIEQFLIEYQDKIIKNNLDVVFDDSNLTWTIFNFNNFESNEIIFIETDKSLDFFDAAGTKLISQSVSTGYYVQVKIPAINSGFITAKPATALNNTDDMLPSQCSNVENQFYKVSWNSNGKITSIIDKSLAREMIKPGSFANDLTLFEDIPRMFDAWELEPYYEDKPTQITNCIRSELVVIGPLLTIVEFEWKINHSSIIQRLILRSDSKRIDFDTTVDWQENEMILRTYFPLTVRSERATFDIQYGNIERPTHKNTLWDLARFEVCAHKWADLSQRDAGVAILNDSKYGYNVINDTIGLSLLKSASMPDKHADRGIQSFVYSFMSHADDWYKGDVDKYATSLNNPLKLVEGKLKPQPLFYCDQPNITIDCIKKAESEEGWIIRFHEYSGSRVHVKLKVNIDYKEWAMTNLMEVIESDFSESEICIDVEPYEIITLLLR